MVLYNNSDGQCSSLDVNNKNAESLSEIASNMQSFGSSMSYALHNPTNVKECHTRKIDEDEARYVSTQVNEHDEVVSIENEDVLLTNTVVAASPLKKKSSKEISNETDLLDGDNVTKGHFKKRVPLIVSQQGTNDNFFHRRHRQGRSKTGPTSTIAFPCRVPRGQMMKTCNISSFGNGATLIPLNKPVESVDRTVSLDPVNGKTSLKHQRNEWITVFKRMFRDLAQESDTTKQTIDKDFFLEYFPLPGVIGERLFDLFDVDKSKTIDFDEFFRGLSIIYNGTLEEKKRFLFNMYDLDNNGRISRAEVSALLSHIPVAFKVLQQVAQCHADAVQPCINAEDTHPIVQKKYPSKTLEGHINSLVQSIFSENSIEHHPTPSFLGAKEKEDTSELSFDEFCVALEKSKEISDVLALFYDDAMPDLPIPVEAFTVSSLKDTKTLFSTCKVDVTQTKEKGWFFSKIIRFFSYFNWIKFSNTLPTPQVDYFKTKDQLQTTAANDDSSFHCKKALSSMTVEQKYSWSDFYDMPNSLNLQIQHAPFQVATLSGWLYKLGRIFNVKCYRFYVLRDQFLYYFTSKNSLTPRNVMFLRGARVSSVCVTDQKRPTFAFDLKLSYHRQRFKRFYAQNREERDEWVDTLSRVACTSRFHEEYFIQKFLGRGRFAVVYEGIGKRTQELVAIKIIPKSLHSKKKRNNAFLRTEVCVLWLTQKHPNIVRLIDVHESSEHVYVVMEWVSDGDLSTLQKEFLSHENHTCFCSTITSRSTPTVITTEILAEIVAWTVARGVLQENILLVFRKDNPQTCLEVSEGCAKQSIGDVPNQRELCPCRACGLCCKVRALSTVKLTDFGLSAILNPEGRAQEPLGTLCYAAPEVIGARPYSKPVDLWALGVVTYHLLSGYRQLPFDRSQEDQLANCIDSADYSFEPESYWNQISPTAKDFVRTLLRHTPCLRPTAVEALQHAWFS
ncbi:uncharacterized protein LOC128883985 isoform X2 [Hylaeus volcanicus]|uniref:uncharacterized protein LOC128883985 isoform X2 n=1 Tax=Hylaeus volcanicus TaxID=313075 RepID=UPI0023B81799|nr:uncharacterized protein LOC128883985 isoform X2 [Hylaeus volcanicus]